jgi:ABC-type bacteriocin/lantibiotic exporter with double-glycine peptidase domain
MVAIKRCLKLFEIPHENLDQPRHKDEQWPQKGSIEMKNFHLRYREDTELVLKDCSFKIEAG